MKVRQSINLSLKFVCAAAFLLIALFPSTASAQFDSATLLGTVQDSAGAIIPNAAVTLKNTETGSVVTAATDAEGNYQFLNVKIGTYEVTAEAAEFSKVTVDLTSSVSTGNRSDRVSRLARHYDFRY